MTPHTHIHTDRDKIINDCITHAQVTQLESDHNLIDDTVGAPTTLKVIIIIIIIILIVSIIYSIIIILIIIIIIWL